MLSPPPGTHGGGILLPGGFLMERSDCKTAGGFIGKDGTPLPPATPALGTVGQGRECTGLASFHDPTPCFCSRTGEMRLEVLPWAQVREGTWEGLPGMVTGWAEGAPGASGTLGEDLSHHPGYRGVQGSPVLAVVVRTPPQSRLGSQWCGTVL